MSKLIISILLIPILCSIMVESCSLACGEDTRVCLNNADGYLGADCSGLSDEIVCATESDPCMNQCLPQSPVLSKDGKSCQKCYRNETSGEEICPKCKSGEVWCHPEKLCKNEAMPCNGQCPLYLYPVLSDDGETCEQCPVRDIFLSHSPQSSNDTEDYDYYYNGGKSTRWCIQSKQCFDPENEPCNGRCFSWNKWFCSASDSCRDNQTPCQQKCNSYRWYCSKTDTCLHTYDACDETCIEGKRYCNLTQSCLDDSTPCGSKCSNDRKFCAVHNMCQTKDQHCPCANDLWGCTTSCHNGTCSNSCHLKFEETVNLEKIGQTHIGEICEKDRWGQYKLKEESPGRSSTTYLRHGMCHPNYKLCPGTATCIPNYQDEDSMCKEAVPTTTDFFPF